MKIKNVIFDFGQVIVHFEPEYMVGKYVSDPEDKALLCEVVFDRLYWDKLDKGTITDEETLDAVCARLPERLHSVAKEIYYNWIYNIPEIDGMRELVGYIKEKYGVRVLLLSNISRYFASHRDEIPILKEFEYCVLSALIGITKPSAEIFEHLCTVCQIKPEESVFIDDNRANIEASIKFGLNGYVFDGSAERLKGYLDSILGE